MARPGALSAPEAYIKLNFCFFLGGGILATAKQDKKKADAGNNIIIGGLVLQLLWFAIFVVVAAVFHRRLAASPTSRAQQPGIRWRSYLITLYVASGLIMIRSLFRVVEYVQGNNGYLLSLEVYLYIFDALMMFVTVSWFNWRHPGEIGLLLRNDKADDGGHTLLRLRSNSKTLPV